MADKKYVFGAAHSEKGDTIQSLPIDHDTDTYNTITTTAVRTDVTGSVIIRIATSVDAFIKFGTSGVTSVANTTGSTYHPAGTEVYTLPDEATHVSIVRESSSIDGFGTVTKIGD